MKITLTSITPNAERHCEMAARTCYSSGKLARKDGKPSTLVKGMTKKGHLTTIGHGMATFKITGTSRSCIFQFVRHRGGKEDIDPIEDGNESQKSQRFVEEGGFAFITPPKISNDQWCNHLYKDHMKRSEELYSKLRERGIPREDARYVIPESCETVIEVSKTLDRWLVFLKNRMDKHAQWEIREMAYEIYRQLNKEAPLIFNKETIEAYIVPQIDWSSI